MRISDVRLLSCRYLVRFRPVYPVGSCQYLPSEVVKVVEEIGPRPPIMSTAGFSVGATSEDILAGAQV
jgi:hypothetical protein